MNYIEILHPPPPHFILVEERKMSATQGGKSILVHNLSTLLRNNGDSVLDGSRTLTLHVTCIQLLTHLFEQYLISHTRHHSFLALPSHPADTTALLQVQFLFDMLQKTISLKLVHPSGQRLNSIVNIYPLKSLKHLELKRIPPQCLQGLCGIYSQLESFTCSKSLTRLEELLLLCGGDVSTALPWLELHTLNFSYNSISCLDESLKLLNVLQSLDLSHNKIQECAEFLKPLCELKHLNLSYNNLQRAPELGLNTRSRLVTLVLRHNELDNIHGMEHLWSLQHLDLAYNLLMEHNHLEPLSLLHNLKMLSLEGNPLYFQKTHRKSTVYRLSPQAAIQGIQLDGSALTSTELAVLAKPRQLPQMSQTLPVTIPPEQNVQDMSSGGGELSDSLSVSESGAKPVYKRKSKSKVKVRAVSISEPSDTGLSTSLQDITLHHKKDIEKLDSFREKMGEDWLRYQHHLQGTPGIVSGPKVNRHATTESAENHCILSPRQMKSDCTVTTVESLDVSLLSSKSKKDDDDILDFRPETEFTLQGTGNSFVDIESTLETSPQLPEKANTDPAVVEEEALEVDLCRPMLVRLLFEIGDFNRKKESEPLFLRVHQSYILEVDIYQGCVRSRFELDCLRLVSTSQAIWTTEGKESIHPVLELHFSYISQEKQKRRYIVLDDDPEETLQVLLELLSRVATENKRQEEKERTAVILLQCLKCQAEFSEPSSQTNALSKPDVQPRYQDKREKENTAGDAVCCPECNSDHVIQLAGQTALNSTPDPCDTSQNCEKCFRFGYSETQKDEAFNSPIHVRTFSEISPVPEGTTDTFLVDQCGQFKRVSSQIEDYPRISSVSQLTGDQEESEHRLSQRCCFHSLKKEMLFNDFVTIDHRLKLFLDVEIFEGEEEIHCFLKMSIVKFGNPVEFPSLVVVSNQRLYILQITSQSEGHPSEWLQKRDSHQLCDLSYLEIGLGSQSIQMEFDVSNAAYTLLVRDSTRCKHFFNQLTAITTELNPKSDKLKTVSATLNPKHYLWPLICEVNKTHSERNSHLSFFYLMAFLQLGDSLTSVTVLATQETLCLIDENHQWRKSCSTLSDNKKHQPTNGKVTLRESQPISSVSSILLCSYDPCQVDIQLYDEVAKMEKTWHLRSEAVLEIQGLVNWIKEQWEAMFGVKLITTIH